MPDIAKWVVRNRAHSMISKLVKEKRLAFVNDHQVVYTDKENITRTLTFVDFATLAIEKAIEKAPQETVRSGITAELFNDVLVKEYKRDSRGKKS